jgi:MraZ protein
MRRGFFPTAFQAEIDRQGRVLVPPQLRRWASLEGEVVVIGIGDGIEVWDARAFDEALSAAEADMEALNSE